MTPEQAQKYNIPAIQGRRGEWQAGDMVYSHKLGIGCVFIADEEITEVYFQSETGSWEYKTKDNKLIWLPRAIDDDNDERGLILMCQGFNGLCQLHNKKWLCKWWIGNGLQSSTGDTPTDALLQAITEQNK